jgi:hypothetical protein
MNKVQTHLMSVCLCVVDDMKRVKPTRCYAILQYLDAQTYSHAPDQQPAITKARCHTLEPSVQSQAPDDGHNDARNVLSDS